MKAATFDALVVGGGPAGAAAAFALARRGVGVVVVESKQFPRTKVCGEFVSPAATALLESIVGRAALHGAGARLEDRFVLELGDRALEWRMPRAGWALSRASLDALLLSRAMDAGARAVQGVAVRRVSYGDDGVAASLADGAEIGARVVVHADGVGRLDPLGAIDHRAGVVAHKRHMRTPVEGLRMRAGNGAYIGTIEVERGLATCALVARATLVRRFGGDLDAMVASLWPGYRADRAEGPWMSCGVPGSSFRPGGHARSFRIGNAAAGVEPVGGEGIGMALWSGLALAETLELADPAASQRRYARAFRDRLRRRRLGCRMAGWALERPALVEASMPALAALLAPAWMLTGKPV